MRGVVGCDDAGDGVAPVAALSYFITVSSEFTDWNKEGISTVFGVAKVEHYFVDCFCVLGSPEPGVGDALGEAEVGERWSDDVE